MSMTKLAQTIQASARIAVLTGAGISTESGMPDFRSVQGVWTYDRSREQLMSLSYYRRYPELFWPAYKDIFKFKLFGKYRPNYGHQFLVELEKQGKEVTIITQNVDGLHSEAGSSNVLEIHGSMKKAHCLHCDVEYGFAYILHEEIPRCNVRKSTGELCNLILKPGIVLFEDAIHHYNEALEAALDADLFMVLGSSLQVSPINQLPVAVHRNLRDQGGDSGATLVIINRESTDMDRLFHMVFHRGIGSTFTEVKDVSSL